MKKLASLLLFCLFVGNFIMAQTPDKTPPLPPPPPKEEETSPFDRNETQPYFPGCEEMAHGQGKRKCSETKMLEYLFKNLKYPKKARKKKCQGTVYISFVIEKDGSLNNHKIVRDIGCGCGEEALRVVKAMPNWEPGTQRGRPVRVQFNLPIKFKLD